MDLKKGEDTIKSLLTVEKMCISMTKSILGAIYPSDIYVWSKLEQWTSIGSLKQFSLMVSKIYGPEQKGQPDRQRDGQDDYCFSRQMQGALNIIGCHK